jgi:hypothetical protein
MYPPWTHSVALNRSSVHSAAITAIGIRYNMSVMVWPEPTHTHVGNLQPSVASAIRWKALWSSHEQLCHLKCTSFVTGTKVGAVQSQSERVAWLQLAEVMKEAGFTLDTSTGLALARSLKAIASVRPEAAGLVGALATRAMSEAEYFSTGTPPPNPPPTSPLSTPSPTAFPASLISVET